MIVPAYSFTDTGAVKFTGASNPTHPSCASLPNRRLILQHRVIIPGRVEYHTRMPLLIPGTKLLRSQNHNKGSAFVCWCLLRTEMAGMHTVQTNSENTHAYYVRVQRNHKTSNAIRVGRASHVGRTRDGKKSVGLCARHRRPNNYWTARTNSKAAYLELKLFDQAGAC